MKLGKLESIRDWLVLNSINYGDGVLIRGTDVNCLMDYLKRHFTFYSRMGNDYRIMIIKE